MTALVPIQWHNTLPAYLQNPADVAEAGSLGAAFESRAFARISTKDNRFSLINLDGESMPVNQLDPKSGQPFVDVVFVKWSDIITKTWYAQGYTEGADNPPDCYSLNGATPEPDSPLPQAAGCAMCPKNAFGSATNGRGKACSDAQRTAIVLGADTPVIHNGAARMLKAGEEVFGYRIPPMTGKNLRAKVLQANKAGANFKGMSVRAHFVSQGVVDFAFLGYLSEAAYKRSRELAASEAADLACGTGGTAAIPLATPPAHLQIAPGVVQRVVAQGVVQPATVSTASPTAAPAAALDMTMFQNQPGTTAPAPTAAPKRGRGRPPAQSAAPVSAPGTDAGGSSPLPSGLSSPATPIPNDGFAAPASPSNGVIATPQASSPEMDAQLEALFGKPS